MAAKSQTFEHEIVQMPPEDLAFLSGVLQALTAMYCRLHPVQTEPRKEEHHEQ